VAVLAEAAGDGRLTLDEHTERVHRAYSARTLGELAGLTEDLVEPSAQPLRLDASRSVAALFTTQRREGRWVMPDRLVVTVVGGHVVLDLREALLLGTRIALLEAGRLVTVLTPDEFLQSHEPMVAAYVDAFGADHRERRRS